MVRFKIVFYLAHSCSHKDYTWYQPLIIQSPNFFSLKWAGLKSGRYENWEWWDPWPLFANNSFCQSRWEKLCKEMCGCRSTSHPSPILPAVFLEVGIAEENYSEPMVACMTNYISTCLMLCLRAQSFNGLFSAGLILALHCWVFLWVNFFHSLVYIACRN